jgi:PIN domain nuclease of toxin-antitoxin system
VKLLLDTHILLWWLAAHPSLPADAADAIADPGTEVFVSAASAWEISIKKAAGRLTAPDDLVDVMTAGDISTLAITAGHALRAGALPPHHTDPFDRMLIAQAHMERLTLVSVDSRFAAYEVALLPLRR